MGTITECARNQLDKLLKVCDDDEVELIIVAMEVIVRTKSNPILDDRVVMLHLADESGRIYKTDVV